MDTSQDHGAALHGSSSCQVRCCTVQRPQCALLSAADHPRRAGVERSTSSTSAFIASTGTAAVGRKPPAQLRRRADATAGHMGPVVIRADLVVPPVSAEGDAVCVYRCVFFHFIDEYRKFSLLRSIRGGIQKAENQPTALTQQREEARREPRYPERLQQASFSARCRIKGLALLHRGTTPPLPRARRHP